MARAGKNHQDAFLGLKPFFRCRQGQKTKEHSMPKQEQPCQYRCPKGAADGFQPVFLDGLMSSAGRERIFIRIQIRVAPLKICIRSLEKNASAKSIHIINNIGISNIISSYFNGLENMLLEDVIFGQPSFWHQRDLFLPCGNGQSQTEFESMQ